MIEKRPFCVSISAHRHVHQHLFLTKENGWEGPVPHHHIVNVTVSGSWWRGPLDERGIPQTLMADGAPNGYSIMSFDGTDYSLEFFAAGRSKDYQMLVQCPEVVTGSESGETDLYANVFNANDKSVVQFRMSEDSPWLSMEKVFENDPNYIRVFELQESLGKTPWSTVPGPRKSTHLWKAKLPEKLKSGTHLIHVQAENSDGIKADGYRVLRVSAE
jgi:hypothetical protein